MKEKKNFWDRNARIYNRFMRKDREAYETMYALIRPAVKGKTVLELATGTGLIAKNIVNAAAHIEATDASAEMIADQPLMNGKINLDSVNVYVPQASLNLRFDNKPVEIKDKIGRASCRERVSASV